MGSSLRVGVLTISGGAPETCVRSRQTSISDSSTPRRPPIGTGRDAVFFEPIRVFGLTPSSERFPILASPAEGCGRIDHRERGIGIAAWITCHKGVATAGFGRRRADGIFEVRPRQRECPSDDVVIDRSDGEDANETFHALARERRVTSLLEEVEDRGDAVGEDHPVPLSAFDGCPQRGGDIRVGRTVEDDVEEDVQIQQKTLHRYFRMRCRRCASAGTPRAAPRSIRSGTGPATSPVATTPPAGITERGTGRDRSLRSETRPRTSSASCRRSETSSALRTSATTSGRSTARAARCPP